MLSEKNAIANDAANRECNSPTIRGRKLLFTRSSQLICSVAAWVARKFNDPVAQTAARDVGEAKYHYAFIWYDPQIKAAPAPASLLDDRMLNDLVVSRSGWQAWTS